MKNLAFETFNQLDLFDDYIFRKENIVLNIPHSSTHIPSYLFFDKEKIQDEIVYLTDWYCDKIFNIDGVNKIIANFSRLFCDIERFDDKNEPMFNNGMGFYYIKNSKGEELRKHNFLYKNLFTIFL